jgi:hypothetical protein
VVSPLCRCPRRLRSRRDTSRPLSQRERSVALLAFLGNLAIAPSQSRKRKLCDFQSRFVCFGIGVMLAASANAIALLIQNVAIAHPKEAEGRFARRLRTIGIGMVVASLIPFAIGMTVAATHWRIWFGRWISPPWRIPTMALGRFHPLATSSGNGRYLLTPAVPSGGFGSLQSTLRDVPPAPRSMPDSGG